MRHPRLAVLVIALLALAGTVVYLKILARITGPNPGVFGGRTLGRTYTCSGVWQLTS